MELNGWTSPQMLRRYGASARSASARSARARGGYDRVMQDRVHQGWPPQETAALSA